MLQETYSIGAFSKMTGLSIRTLHYYDEIGLLKPQRQGGGHRRYETKDALILQKIVSLKTLGFNLERIKQLLQQQKYDLTMVEMLRLQQQTLEHTRAELDKSLEMIARMITIVEREGELDHQLLFNLIRNMSQENNQRKWVEEHLSEHTAELIFDGSADRMKKMDEDTVRLINDVKRLAHGPTNSPEVEEIIGGYIKQVTDYLDTESIHKISNLNEADYGSLEQLVDLPFSEEELLWLDEALAHCLTNDPLLANTRSAASKRKED
ncbi:MerR family transcriptional regulator [Paenibacillus septentrionalis]|uniref:MerR family transcriptional regulator n=1 Tax=Paenibacillus septentrionalis TaxID=429342 RepID=A0ABW1V5V8_9BACL